MDKEDVIENIQCCFDCGREVNIKQLKSKKYGVVLCRACWSTRECVEKDEKIEELKKQLEAAENQLKPLNEEEVDEFLSDYVTNIDGGWDVKRSLAKAICSTFGTQPLVDKEVRGRASSIAITDIICDQVESFRPKYSGAYYSKETLLDAILAELNKGVGA